MDRNELAQMLGYKNEEEWDKQLSNSEYMNYIRKCAKYIGECYVIGSRAYDDR